MSLDLKLHRLYEEEDHDEPALPQVSVSKFQICTCCKKNPKVIRLNGMKQLVLLPLHPPWDARLSYPPPPNPARVLLHVLIKQLFGCHKTVYGGEAKDHKTQRFQDCYLFINGLAVISTCARLYSQLLD